MPVSFNELVSPQLDDHYQALSYSPNELDSEHTDWNIYRVYAVSDPANAATPDEIQATLDELNLRPTELSDPATKTFPREIPGSELRQISGSKNSPMKNVTG